MRAFYALVDDILTWEEFEEEVFSINPDPHDEESENLAAAEVAEKYGRLHLKISELNSKPTLNFFFCKIIEIGPVIEFKRDDNTPGVVRRVLTGDETGEAVLVFFDEKVSGTEEIAVGDVLEVAGRFRSLSTINAVDLRRVEKEIFLREDGIKTLLPVSLKALVLEKSGILQYTKKDQTFGEMEVMFVCMGKTTARIISWNPENLTGITEGMSIYISGLMQKPSKFKEFILGDSSEIKIISRPDELVKPEFLSISDLYEVLSEKNDESADLTKKGAFDDKSSDSFFNSYKIEGLNPCNITGFVTSIDYVSGLPHNSGDTLWLKKGILCDISKGSPKNIPFVLWGKHAKLPVFKGDLLELYNCRLKKSGNEKEKAKENSFVSDFACYEIHAGYNTCVKVLTGSDTYESDDYKDPVCEKIKGVLECFPEGLYLVGELGRYFLSDNSAKDIKKYFSAGDEVILYGYLKGRVIDVVSAEPVLYSQTNIEERLLSFKNKFFN